MHYLTTDAIVSAFKSVIKTDIDRAFITLLFLLKNSPPNNNQSFSMHRVPFDKEGFVHDINHLFSFQDIESGRVHAYNTFFILTDSFVEFASRDLLKSKKLELTAIATVCLQTEIFDSAPSESELTDLFIQRFNLSDELTDTWFENSNKITLSYSTSAISNSDRKRALEGTFPNPSENITLSMKGTWLHSLGGDFGSGTYAQLLNTTSSVKELVFIPSGEFQKHLGIEHTSVTHPIKNANLNSLYFGPAGTGKSTLARKDAITFGVSPSNLTEVTFHPEYTYTDFIGGLKPKSLFKAVDGVKIHKSLNASETIYDGYEPLIEFKFEPGPFTLACINAAKDKDNPHAIIIDELNRGNVPEILGDIFQLLDRNGNKSKTNSELISFLVNECDCSFFENGFEIPPNLYVFGTINPADQNVFTLDTAFKRRWKRKYVPINYTEDACKAMQISICGTQIRWLPFIKALNEFLVFELELSEDKQIGQFFLDCRATVEAESIKDETLKVMSYLWEDVPKSKRNKLFSKEIKSFSALLEQLDSRSFADLFQQPFIEWLTSYGISQKSDTDEQDA